MAATALISPRQSQQCSMTRTKKPERRRAHQDPEQQSHAAVYQVLPLGNLPEDFAGNPVDGLEYLAWAKKSDKELPFFVTAENPYAQPEASTSSAIATGLNAVGSDAVQPALSNGKSRMISSDGIFIAVDEAVVVAKAERQRHKDLWRESWAVAFGIHWRNYRHYIQNLPQTSKSTTYPVPVPDRAHWEQFIHGAPRKLKAELKASSDRKSKRAGSCSLSEFDIDEDMERQKKVKIEVEIDEEAEMRAMNGEEPISTQSVDVEEGVVEEDMEEEEDKMEPWDLKHEPKEPTMAIIGNMNQQHHLFAIAYLTRYMNDQLARLPQPVQQNLLSTQPNAYAGSNTTSIQQQPSTSFPTIHPFPPLHTQWAFAALASLSPHLTSDSISTIRSFARAALEFAQWLAVSIKSDTPHKEDALAACWMVVLGVAQEWGQRDLIDDAERAFSRL